MSALVQLLIPVGAKTGSLGDLGKIQFELTDKFGGVTMFATAPADGLWQDDQINAVQRDTVVLLEVMVEDVDRSWWRSYRRALEKRLNQKELVVRAVPCETL